MQPDMEQDSITRVECARGIDAVVLATSTDASDDAVASWAGSRRVPCFRGELDNVAGRKLAAMQWIGVDAAVRVNADSPLLSPNLVDQGVALFRENEVDIVTNVAPRTYPKGQSVEVVRATALERVLQTCVADAPAASPQSAFQAD